MVFQKAKLTEQGILLEYQLPMTSKRPNGINQVGCVYTAQGFEFDYARVIFGNDLTYNFDQQTWKRSPRKLRR